MRLGQNLLQQGGAGGGGEQFIAVAHDTSPYVTAYPWSASGFGTKFANPSTLPPSVGYGVAFSET